MCRCAASLTLVLTSALFAAGPADEPENERLSSEKFRRGLKQLGLTDFLDYYIREFPPKDPIQAGILRRELRLNLYADPSVPSAERLRALEQATVTLRNLISQYPDHEERLEWQLDLGRDLIFRKAEPYHNNILFRGGTVEDRKLLKQITSEALRVYDQLISELVAAESQIDNFSIQQFEKFARSGYIERVETLLPKARYFSMWANYYHCLTMEPNSAAMAKPLEKIIHYLNEESKLTRIEHDHSHYQAQSLLLAGMAYRLLQISDRAEQFLFKAGSIASSVPDFAERRSLKWVVTLAALERVKNFRDTGRYDLAAQTLEEYRSRLPINAPHLFSQHFALALLEGTIHAAAARALPAREEDQKAELSLKSREALIQLARDHPRFQDEIYSTLFELLGDVQDPTALDSFAKNVFIAGLLRRASQLNERVKTARKEEDPAAIRRLDREKNTLLGRAANLAESLLSDESVLAVEMHPEARFNLAVCRYEQGHVLEAIAQFNLLLKNHPNYEKAGLAIDYAIRLCESVYNVSGEAIRPTIRSHYLDALSMLLSRYGDSALAPSRQYVYAKVLQEDGQYNEASKQYAQVQSDDPMYREALFHIAECQIKLLRRDSVRDEGRRASTNAALVLDSAERFRGQVRNLDVEKWSRYVAESLLFTAEANMLRPSKSPENALQIMQGFEDRFGAELDLIGRAMRIRILAYQALGNLDQAAAIIPDYIQRDPQNAGGTLQGLLETFIGEIEDARRSGRSNEADRKATDALIVARALDGWAASPMAGLDAESRSAFRIEYGEALLRANRGDDALEVFKAVVEKDAARHSDGRSRNGRALFGLAEANYLAQKPAEALTHFDGLYRQLPEGSELWWKSFLREIQCRMALDQDRQILYNLISQKRVFFPGMGGVELKKEFTKLQVELSKNS